jgi:type IV pilus assembly protein PilB
MATETIRINTPDEEQAQARTLAARYRCDFVDLKESRIDADLFRTVPVDLMFRYHFVPLYLQNGTLEIALADPRQIVLVDELAVLLGK